MPIAAWVVAPPDSVTAPLADETVLDTTPARQMEPTPDSPAQDIVVELPADDGGDEPFPLVTVTFHLDAPDLPAVVAETADLAYVTSGNPGLRAFQDALDGTTTTAFGGLQVPVRTRGEDWYQDDVITPQRGRLRREFEAYLRDLPDRRAAAEEVVQRAAVAGALRRLSASREQVLAEARRYLSLSGGPSSAAAVLGGTGPNRLTGPETVGLVADLVAIAGARSAVAGRQAAQRRAEQEWNRTKLMMLSDDRARAGAYSPYITDAQLQQMAKDLAAIPDSPAVRDARQQTADQREALAKLVAGLAANRPLLFRLWDTDVPFLALRLVQQSRSGNITADRGAVSDSVGLRDAVVARLRTTFQSATELTHKIDTDPELVWSFEPLIEDTLTALHMDASDFVARVAHDRVRAEKPAVELTIWSEWLGYAQLAFGLSGLAPVAAALTVAQVAVDVAAVIAKAFDVMRQQIGEDAFLRPSARLGVSPSYSSVLMDAFDIAIGVLTSPPFDTKLLWAP